MEGEHGLGQLNEQGEQLIELSERRIFNNEWISTQNALTKLEETKIHPGT